MLPQVRPVAVGVVFCVTRVVWVSEHYRVHLAHASQVNHGVV